MVSTLFARYRVKCFSVSLHLQKSYKDIIIIIPKLKLKLWTLEPNCLGLNSCFASSVCDKSLLWNSISPFVKKEC